jgi:hypothetical protein
MAKKAKLELKALRVNSFVTSLDNGEKEELKGGMTCTYCSRLNSCPTYCPTDPYYTDSCPTTLSEECP